MALKGNGRIFQHSEGKWVLYLPAAVIKDSQFPFKRGSKVQVRIAGKKLVVETAPAKSPG